MTTLHVGGRFPHFCVIVFQSLRLQASTRNGRGRTKVHVYLPYRGAISFHVYIVPLGLISIFLYVGRVQISYGRLQTRVRFLFKFPYKTINVKKR